MKAVIPVAGFGTRMLPLTKAIPKEMLPIVDRPLIEYVIHEAIAAGIKEIILVTKPGKDLIKNYFERKPDLESILEDKFKLDLLHQTSSILPCDVTLTYAYQEESKGLGHAILCARSYINDDDFSVLLPDVLINQFESNLAVDNFASMVSRFIDKQISQVMVERIPYNLVSNYGIVDCNIKNNLMPNEIARIFNLIEKPQIQEAPSNLAIVGRYVFSSKIWHFLEKTKAGRDNEIQLTDAMKELMQQEILEAYHLVGRSHDCGEKTGYAVANIHYALQRSEIYTEIYNDNNVENLLISRNIPHKNISKIEDKNFCISSSD